VTVQKIGVIRLDPRSLCVTDGEIEHTQKPPGDAVETTNRAGQAVKYRTRPK
jgi:hypothetical protein